VLLNRDLGTTDRPLINNRISNIKATDTRNRYHYEIKSEIKSETQPWGHFNNGVVSETEHIVNSSYGFTFAYLEYVENVENETTVNHSE
jgi:hypothetical protein